MKKITFVLFALITGTAFAQSASADGQATAKIVSAIKIVANDQLDFGTITPNQGIVVVTPGGFNAGATTANVIGGTIPTPAKYTVTAAEGQVYSVTLPEVVILQIGEEGATMTINDFKHNSNGTEEEFNVGGTLYIADDQAEGVYEGTITVSVDYN